MNLNQILLDSAKRGDLERVRECLKNGADINAKNHFGRSALLDSAQNGHLKIVELLLKNGADIECADLCGTTALMEAAQWGHLAIAKLLLDNGAKLDAKDKNGKCTFAFALEQGQMSIVWHFVKYGASVFLVKIADCFNSLPRWTNVLSSSLVSQNHDFIPKILPRERFKLFKKYAIILIVDSANRRI